MLYSAPSFTRPAQRGTLYTSYGTNNMTINAILQARAGAKCELCSAEQALTAFVVPHSPASDDDH
ncbi:MAG: PhnA domain protein, partial [Aeromonas veronii]